MKDIKFRVWDNVDYMSKPFTLLDVQRRLTQFTHDCTVMQYTGLTDKNGVEIYEGDILSTDLSRPYLVVEFLGGAFMYQCHDSGDDYYDHMSPTCDIRTQDEYCAVIGNVHQNPELLENR